MGSKNSKKKEEKETTTLQKTSFDFLYIIGRGGFGKVWKVSAKRNSKIYAMKEMSKAKIIEKKSEKSIMYERELQTKMEHNFVMSIKFAFQDYDNLYLGMDYLVGGDVRYHLSKVKKFSEEQSKFILACTILALDYIHTNNIIHRDLKPENLVLMKKAI